MPPRGYEEKHGYNPGDPAPTDVAPIHVTSTITKNDGTKGADGITKKRKPWGVCSDTTCERPIYFIRSGERCAYHSVVVLENGAEGGESADA